MTLLTQRALFRSALFTLVLLACHNEGPRAPDVPEPAAAPPTNPPLTMDPAVSAQGTGGQSASSGLPPAGTTDAPTAAESPPAESLRERAPLSDEQIATIGTAANGAEIEQAKIARNKAKDPLARKFAEMMISHHEQAQRELAKLGKKLSMKPAESPLSTELTADAAGALGTLKKATGKDFDGVYAGAQVAAHRRLFELRDQQLLADAKNVDLKTYLQALRQRVEEHLQQAKQLEQTLAAKEKGASSSSSPAAGSAGAAPR